MNEAAILPRPPFWRPAMRNQLTIIAAGLGLAVGGLGLFSVSASAMSASGVAAISEVNHVPDPIGLPVERVQYYPYGYPCVFPFCGYGYYGPGYYGRRLLWARVRRSRLLRARGRWSRSLWARGGRSWRWGSRRQASLTIAAPSETSGGATLGRVGFHAGIAPFWRKRDCAKIKIFAPISSA